MRQPVKGKPHIAPAVDVEIMDGKLYADFHITDGWPSLAIEAWCDRVIKDWDRWWRQHQEAA